MQGQGDIRRRNSNFTFEHSGNIFRAGVDDPGIAYIQDTFPGGSLQRLQIHSDGTIESVYYNGSTWGLNWSSRNSDNDIAGKANGAILFDGDCNALGFGLYLCGGSVKNIPHDNWHMIISAVSGETGVQLGIALFNKDIRVRSLIAGAWESWGGIHV